MLKLAICIPSYNRDSFLMELLESLAKSYNQLSNVLKAQVMVRVHDNASQDDTEKIVNQFRSFVEYSRNETNIGMFENFYLCYSSSNAEYVWVIGDDERVSEYSISKILEYLNTLSPSLIICRADSFDSLVKVPELFKNYQVFSEQAQTYEPFWLLAHSHISVNIVQKKYFNIIFARDKISTLYGQFYGLMYGVSLSMEPVVYSQDALIVIRKDRPPTKDVTTDYDQRVRASQIEYLDWIKQRLNLSIDPKKTIDRYRLRFYLKQMRMAIVEKKLNRIPRIGYEYLVDQYPGAKKLFRPLTGLIKKLRF